MKGEKKMISYSVSKNILLPKINTIQEENNKEANEDNSSIKENSKMDFSDSSDKINENEDNSYMEKQLSLLLEVFLTTYSKKTYQE